MSSDAIMLNEILEKEKRAEESNEILARIQSLFSDDKGWDNEEQMLADMAVFRKRKRENESTDRP